jgi:hypothetical protein
MNDLNSNDPIRIWQNQPINQRNMAAINLHQKTHALQNLTRRKLTIALLGPVVVGLFYAYMKSALPTIAHTLEHLLIASVLWSLAGVCFIHRGMWTTLSPTESALSTGLASCRRELTLQHNLANRILLWMLGPVFLTLGVFLFALTQVSGGILPKGLPFLVCLAVWAIAYAIGRIRQQQSFRQELDELNQIEKQAA